MAFTTHSMQNISATYPGGSNIHVKFYLKFDGPECDNEDDEYNIRIHGIGEKSAYKKSGNHYEVSVKIPGSTTTFEYNIYSEKYRNRRFGNGFKTRQVNVDKGLGGQLIFFDILSSGVTSQSTWINQAKVQMLDMMRNEREYKQIFETIHDIHGWVKQLLDGWTFKTSDGDKHIFPIQNASEILTSALPYIGKYAQSRLRAIRDTIAYLGFTLQISPKINYCKIDSVFKVLSLHDLSLKDQTILYHELSEDENDKLIGIPNVCVIVEKIFTQLKFSFQYKWILILPLYWLMKKDGQIPIPFSDSLMLRTPIAQLPILKEHMNIWEDLKFRSSADTAQCTLTSMLDEIVRIKEVHKWIERPYVYILRGVTLFKLIKEHSSEMRNFDPIIIITKLLDCLTIKKSNITIQDLQNEELKDVFKAFYDKLRKDDEPKKKNDVIRYSIEKVVKGLKEDFSWDVLIWVSQFCSSTSTSRQHSSVADYKIVTTLLPQLLASIKTKNSKKNKVDLFAPGSFENHIQIWNDILRIDWGNRPVMKNWSRTSWQNDILHSIEDLLILISKDKYEEFLTKVENCVPSDILPILNEVLERVAYHCVEINIMKRSSSNFKLLRILRKETKDKFLEQFFEKSIKHLTKENPTWTPDKIYLEFLLDWEGSEQFYKQCYKTLELKKQSEIFKVTEMFRNTYFKLLDGNVSFELLRMIMRKSSTASSIYAAISPSCNQETDADCGRLRAEQLEKLQYIFDNSSLFLKVIDFMASAGVKLEETNLIRSIPRDFLQCSLNDLISILPLSEAAELLSDDVNFVLNHRMDYIFSCVWITEIAKWKRINIERNEKNTLKFAIEKMKDLKNKVLENVQHMFEGDIHLGDLDCWIHGPGKYMFKYGEPNILPGIKDFWKYCRTVGLDAETLRKFSSQVVNVFAQIEVYEKLSRCVPAACLIMKMKDCFGIAEESLYPYVKYISEKIYSKNIMLKDIKKDVFFVAPMLSDLLISDMVEIFENFLKHHDFRYWIQSTMRDAKEINVMCELVANSYSKVTDSPKYSKDHNNFTIIMRDFTNAVNGFAPLLFDIQNKRIPFEELIERCQIVERNFKANPEIGQQWENSAGKLTFFKKVEFQNISVEHESVYVKAKEIAENGIFSISVLPDNQASFMADIGVTVPPSDTCQERKVIPHDDLQDIQALISLMTEGSDQANNTSEIFNARLKVSERFAKVLVELTQARCTLFDTCIVNIYPVQDKRFTIEMKFEGSDPMEENQFELSDVESIASLLEETLEKWQRHVDNQRKQHYFLNEFNIEQMSYLSKELAIYNKKNEEGPLPHQVCALLSIVRRDTIKDMRNLLKEAIDGINGTSRVGEDSNQDGSTGDHAKKVKLVETLRKEARCSREVAKAAIQKEGVDKIKCRRWIIKSQKKAKLIRQLSEKFDEDIAFISPSERKEAKQQTNRSNIILSIKKKCQNFMENGHGLGLGQLGRLLQLLRDQTNPRLLNRTLTLPLKRGTPNLVCHNQKMYETILSLYMEDSDQSLPTSSEVLICSETTSTKTVERFLHRVMKKCENKGTPLFVLAAIDCLGNSVMKDVERIYHNLKEDQLKDSDYQLVILCQNIKSYLALCFEPNTVEGLRIKKDNKIAEYLQSCLIADGRYEKSAAAIDDKRSLVRVVTSSSSGAGKSLYITRLKNKLKTRDTQPRFTTVRFLEKVLTSQQATRKLISENSPVTHEHLVHLDISTAVKSGIEEFLFNLLILGSIEGNDGKIWQRHSNHYYVIEVTDDNLVKKHSDVSLLNLLPRITTLQPHEIFNHTSNEENAIGMDNMKFESAEFQRPYQYFKHRQSNLNNFIFEGIKGNKSDCIKILLENCQIPDPTWAQLHAFVRFMNIQLETCERSVYCGQKGIPGLKNLAMELMVRMSCDFAFNAYGFSDKDHKITGSTWYDLNRPCIFFNEDGETMTFINVQSEHIMESNTQQSRSLHNSLNRHQALGINLNSKSRAELLEILCLVMGIPSAVDPDPSYELTADNVLKLIAIHMRMRCKVPVILMGETGCGKTRMMEFMKELLQLKSEAELLFITKKIYGGITISDIQDTVWKALDKCRQDSRVSRSKSNPDSRKKIVYLFFDEVNTTEAVHAIKELMCDQTCDGELLDEGDIQVIAACNPYKILSEKAIQRLQKSSLGGNIHVNQSDQIQGEPMHDLLYKVVPMPPSMQIFVWEFGEIDAATEELYIRQMSKKVYNNDLDLDIFCRIICKAQQYMRNQNSECRFVSLRDVERCLEVYRWFYEHKNVLFDLLQEKSHNFSAINRTRGIWEIFQTIGVCYHVSLEERREFRKEIMDISQDVCPGMGQEDLLYELEAVQNIFINEAKLEENISQNESLRENFFMMAICADLKMPLFILGKPGSSKSLAKTTISTSMRGAYSESKLFSRLKEARIFTLQCSALTKDKDILHIFNLCTELQSGNKNFVAVAALEEIGLAEDSPTMPLKVLHPLLDSHRVVENDKTNCGFYGISNWPLDPAKLNRGLFLLRSPPKQDELINSAVSICGEDSINENSRSLLKELANTYMKLYTNQTIEFFGLRDFYSLIKSIQPNPSDVLKVWTAISRNFSGSDHDVSNVFKQDLQKKFPTFKPGTIPLTSIVEKNLGETDSRFLLLQTNSHASLNLISILLKGIIGEQGTWKPVFGSAFPGDKNFTEYCRNVRHIKTYMETGETVVLLNLSEIHESFYDALNQHYVTLGDKRYVDIGFKGHSVKTSINQNFRLIIIENKEKVQEYPIPLINRLEKHFLNAECLLKDSDIAKANDLKTWMETFVSLDFRLSDIFIGYQEDFASCAILRSNGDIKNGKQAILQTVTLDAIYRLGDDNEDKLRYLKSNIHFNLMDLLIDALQDKSKVHSSDMLKDSLQDKSKVHSFEVVTFSNILPAHSRLSIEKELNLPKNSVMILDLKAYEARHQLEEDLDCFLNRCKREISEEELTCTQGAVLILQCPQAERNGELMEFAKHVWDSKNKENLRIPIVVIILWSVERSVYTQSVRVQICEEFQLVYLDEVRHVGSALLPSCHLMKSNFLDLFHVLETDPERTTKFLQNCLGNAFGKIQGSSNAQQRYLQRFKSLLTMFEENGMLRKKLMCKFHNALKIIESEFEYSIWMVLEAKKKESLQESGTFYNTLLLRFKTILSNLIAHFISTVDVHGNLNHIMERSDWKLNLWFKILDCFPLDIPKGISSNDFRAVTPNHPCPTYLCDIPFSFCITKFLDNTWEDMENSENEEIKVIQVFQNFWAYEAIESTKYYEEIKNGYIRDLVKTNYIPGNECNKNKESDIAIKVVKEVANQLLNNYHKAKLIPSEPQSASHYISTAYIAYRKVKANLSKLSEVFVACPTILNVVDTWLKDVDMHGSNIHISALKSAITILEDDVKNMSESDPRECMLWIENSNNIQHTLNSIKISLESKQILDLMCDWNPIYLLNILVLLLTPNEKPQKYVPILVWAAKFLTKESEDKDNDNYWVDYTLSICGMLEKCYDMVNIKMKVRWGSEYCSCGDPFQQPMHSKCGHFCCQTCYKNKILSRDPKKCITCDDKLEDNDILPAEVPSNEIKQLNDFKSNCTSFFKEFIKSVCSMKIFEKRYDLVRLFFELVCEEDWQSDALDEDAESDDSDEIEHLETMALDLDINTKSFILLELLRECNTNNEIKDKIEIKLKNLDKDKLTDFVRVLLYIMEQKVECQTAWVNYNEHFQNFFKIIFQSELVQYSMDFVSAFAALRQSMRVLALEIHQSRLHGGFENTEFMGLIHEVTQMFKSHEIYSNLNLFLIKVGCRKYGISWFKQLLGCDVTKALVPVSLAEETDGQSIFLDIFWSVVLRWNEPTGDHCSNDLAESAAISPENLDERVKLDHDLQSILNKNSNIGKKYSYLIQLLTLSVQALVQQNCYLMDMLESLANDKPSTSSIKAAEIFEDTSYEVSQETISFVQVLLYCCLLIGYTKNPRNVKKILSDPDLKIDTSGYLLQKLEDTLKKFVGNQDTKDFILFFFGLLHRISDTKKGMESQGHTCWATDVDRKKWIQAFYVQYFQEIFENREALSKMAEETSKKILMPVYNLINEDLPQQNSFQNALAEYTIPCSIEQVKKDMNHSDQARTLKYVLETENFESLEKLDLILKFQNMLVKRCQYKKSLSECERTCIGVILHDENEEKVAKEYISIYNKILPSLSDEAGKLSLTSPIIYFLPSNTKEGEGAKQIVQHITNIQNQVLETQQDKNLREIDVSQLLPTHIVSIDINRDILPLVQMHAKYDIRQDAMGLEHRITYNLEAINKLVQEKFLKHKRKINSKTLPLMVWYTQCKGIETEWKLICERFPQKSLPANLVEAVDETSSYSIAVYSGVRALATGIAVIGTQQLGMEEEIKDDTIRKFLCERLHVSSSDLSAIPTMIKIEHILALYSRLSWHRSLLFITRGLDPYKELFNEGSQEEIKDEKLIKEVQDAFEIINMSSFQQQLNQLIVRIPGTLPDKSLARDILSSFSLPFTGGMEQGVLKLPPDICFRHICWLMKRAVKYKNGLN